MNRNLRTAIRRFALPLLCAHFGACGESGDAVPRSGADLDYSGFSVSDVAAEMISAEPTYGQLGKLVLAGPRLWVLDHAGTPFLHVIDARDGRLIESFGRKGQGPAEFASVTGMGNSSPSDSTVWVWDRSGTRVTWIGFQPGNEVPNRSVSYVRIKGAPALYLYPRGRRGFLATYPLEADEYFTLFSETGQPLGTSALRLPGADSIPLDARMPTTSGTTLCSRLDGSGYAMTWPYAGRVQLLDSAAKSKSEAAVPFPSVEAFARPQTGGQLELVRGRVHYRACTFSANSLFAVFIGEMPKDGDEPWEGKYIHVFTLSGELVRVLKLDVTLSGLTSDSAGTTLYGVSGERGEIYRIRVPSLEPGRR